jgi:uncharacterized coiled-coil protein SlyX
LKDQERLKKYELRHAEQRNRIAELENEIGTQAWLQTKPLSDEEIDEIIIKFWQGRFGKRVWDKGLLKDFARAIESKVRGEK